ncbi:MAG: sulfatase-like hydrolase/transferase [Phycisphaeraceae bacterium]
MPITPLLALLTCVLCAWTEAKAETTPHRPNIVLMMADDMGWGAVDFPVRLGETAAGDGVMYPGTRLWRTPNLRAMAEGGLVFSRMYSQAPTCSPTRASVLTGRAPQRIGIPFANRGKMENREATLAEYAQALGYRTGFFGKWHCGVFTREVKDANRGGKPGSHAQYSTPLNNGFDTQYATESKTSTYDPGTSGLTTPTRYWTGPGAFVPLDADELRGDDSAIIAREATAFIEDAVAEGRPFFVVVWFHTPHKPVNTPNNTHVDNLNAFKFAMEDMDRAVGSIRGKLRALGVADQTLLCFTSDNGPEDDQDYCADPLRANKRELYEGGVRVPGLIEWPTRIEPGTSHTPMVTSDYLPTILDIWGVAPVDARPIDGTSLKALLLDDHATPRDQPIFFKSNRYQAVIAGDNGRYKLISIDGGKNWELYDLLVDYREQDPLITSGTAASTDQATRTRFASLSAKYRAWETSVQRSLEDGITGDYQTRVKSIAGAALHNEPPMSLKPGAVKSSKPRLYLERQHAIVPQALEFNGDVVEKGTVVHSFLLHHERVDSGETPVVKITFEDDIVAVATTLDELAGTDALSFADPLFDSDKARGLENHDAWSVSEDGKTLRIALDPDGQGLDQVRVLTRSSLNDTLEPRD